MEKNIAIAPDILIPSERLEAVKADPDDNKVIECGVPAAADRIVTGDKHLLSLGEFQGIRIGSVAEFLGAFDEISRKER